MALGPDIAATYRAPGRVVARLWAQDGLREAFLVVILLLGCLMMFVSQWPRQARVAHINDTALEPLLGGALIAWMFFAPLLLYGLAALISFGLRLIQPGFPPLAARLALFWSFLAASPLVLLHGLVAGFIGPGPALTAVGAIWLGIFTWFLVSTFSSLLRETKAPQ